MLCKKCGSELPCGADICPKCGTFAAPEGLTVPEYDEQTGLTLRKAGQAKAYGIVGIITGMILPPLGVILGAVAVGNANKGLAVSPESDFRIGKIIGYVSIAVSILSIIGGISGIRLLG